MTDFVSRAASASSFSTLQSKAVTVVDLSKEPERPNIVREGLRVPAVKVRPELIDTIVVKPVDPLRVVFQSIAPGARVPKGTVVDIKVADPIDLKIDIIQGAHRSLAQRTIRSVIDQFLESAALRQSVLAAETAADLTETARAQILQVAAGNDVVIDETDPLHNFNALFTSLQGAAAFR